jgi:hypothetical protein
MENHIWIFKDVDDQWQAFPEIDQKALGLALQNSDEKEVSVIGGRCDANVKQRYMRTVYDIEPKELRIQRAVWFAEGAPLSETDSQAISDWLSFESSNTTPLVLGDRKFFRASDGSVMLAGQSLLSVARPVIHVKDAGLKQPPAGEHDTSIPCSHLIIAVHGIGESLWSKKTFSLKPFDVNCAAMRSLIQDLDTETRTELLHINWFHIISASAYMKRISDITLPSIPIFRQIANEAIADAIFYLNSEHKDKIISHVAERIVHIATLFKQRNPSWNNKISLIGHSLGSVICYDVLNDKKLPPEIRVSNVFLFGSPLALFLTARGQSDAFPVTQCARIYNIIQPNDPVAYRIEPFMAPVLKGTEPALIPYHKTGGLATTTQVRHTASSIIGLFRSDGDASYLDKITEVVKGPALPKPDSALGIGLAEIENVNGGDRIDWSVQQGFMPGATEYADALIAHIAYFDNKDIILFIHDRLGR